MTFHAETMQSSPATRTRWMRPEEVRTPVTVKEGDAALDVIDHAMGRLEETIARRNQRGEDSTGLKTLLASWESRRTEVAYTIERLEAGDSPASVEAEQLRAQIHDLARQNSDLLKHTREQRAQLSAQAIARPPRQSQIADLERQIADLTAKNARLTEALRVAAPPVQAPPDEVKRALKRSAHDAFAFGAEALDELVAAGVDLTPMAALFLDHCNNSVPRGYRVEWRAKDGVFKRAAAESRSENQAMRAAGSEP
jgi:hypothetical protein